jgi:hypothetical protein
MHPIRLVSQPRRVRNPGTVARVEGGELCGIGRLLTGIDPWSERGPVRLNHAKVDLVSRSTNVKLLLPARTQNMSSCPGRRTDL